MGYHGRFEKQKNKQKKKGLKVLLIIFVLLIALIGAAVVGILAYINKMAGKMDIITLPEDTYVYTEETSETSQSETTATVVTTAPAETTVPAMKAEDIINILVVGQAGRDGETTRMADSTILVTINTYNKTIKLSSVYRDAYVSLPAYAGKGPGRNKFNVCYNLGYVWSGNSIAGAMEMTNICMKDNFGVEIDHNIEMDFESFIKVIDYMGGVEIELTEAEAKYLNGDDLYVKYDVQPGKQYLDGMAALSYARMRKAEGDGESDIVRTERQRKLIEALFNKIRYLSISELQGVADTLLPLITTTMRPGDIADILLRVLPMVKDLKIEKGTIPVEGTYWGEMKDIYGDGGSHSILKFDSAQQKKLIRAFTEAEPVE